MNKVQLEILMLAESVTFNSTYSLVLGEKNAGRRFSLVIGKPEAQAIALSLDGLNPNRPLTHDLMQKSFQVFNIDIIEVIITQLKEGVFYSVVVCKKGEVIVEIDSRTSDAIALALRFKCPIYANTKILDEVGTEIEEAEKLTIEQFEEELEEELKEFAENFAKGNEFDVYTNEQLEEMIEEALAEENYEHAAKLRDELNKRES
ncbi:MAG: bifunctional nuclease domain-containing protein [Chitinophagales bacterium]